MRDHKSILRIKNDIPKLSAVLDYWVEELSCESGSVEDTVDNLLTLALSLRTAIYGSLINA